MLERLAHLPNARFTYGNTDRYITDGTRPRPTHAGGARRSLQTRDIRRGRFVHVLDPGRDLDAGWLPFLDVLPLEQRLTLPDGARLLGVHASPGMAEGKGLRPDYPLVELRERIDGCDADLLCVGHTHWPMNAKIAGIHVVNLGSVSNPVTPDGCAWYALLEANEDGYRLRQRRVSYDHAAVYALLDKMRHPAAGYITSFLRGERSIYVQGWPLPPVEDAEAS